MNTLGFQDNRPLNAKILSSEARSLISVLEKSLLALFLYFPQVHKGSVNEGGPPSAISLYALMRNSLFESIISLYF